MSETPPVISMRGIVKRFPGVLANDRVDFDLRRGEVHALLGENGAGKSTLMNILAGLYRADSGAIVINGAPAAFGSPRQAIQAGVSAYIVEGIQTDRLQPILDVAMARFEADQALRAQLNARDQQLAERKRIELAKGLLMKMKQCGEEEAYTLMRRQAMSRQQKLIQVAEQIIAMHDMLGN